MQRTAYCLLIDVLGYTCATSSFLFFFFMVPPPPTSPLFPYTTLFRSRRPCHPGRRPRDARPGAREHGAREDRKSTRLNSSHRPISYAVFSLRKQKAVARPTLA